MDTIKKIISLPYTYILIVGYYGIWLTWDKVFVPYRNPYDVVGALSQIHYNPLSNILRFCIAIFLPAILCLIYWLLARKSSIKFQSGLFKTTVVCLSLFVLVASAIMQSSTSGTNDPYTYGGPYNDTLVDTFHEGETLGAAESYEHKDLVPYRDIVFVHGVFQDPLRSEIAFKIFGRSIGAERAFSSLLTIGTFLLFYTLLLVLFRGSLIKAALVSIATGLILLPVLGNTLPAPLGNLLIAIQLPSLDFETILFLIVAILGIRAYKDESSRKLQLYSLVLGFIVTAGYANAIDRALFLSGVGVVWLVILAIMSPFRFFFRSVFLPCLLGGIAGIVLLGFALKGDFHDFLGFLYHISLYKEFLDGYTFSRPSLAENIILAALSLSVLAAGTTVARKFSTKEHAITAKFSKENARKIKHALRELLQEHAITVILFVTALFFLRSAIGRADYAHFAYSIMWTYLFIWYVLLQYLDVRLVKTRHLMSYLVVLLLAFSSIYYGVLVKNVHIKKNTFPIHIPDSDLIRPDYKQAADYLKTNLKSNQSFVTLTSEASWYYFVDKPSPLKYPIVWFAGANYARQELAKSLADNTNIRYVVTNSNWTSDIDYVPTNQRLPEVYQALYAKYAPYKVFGQQTLWKRK